MRRKLLIILPVIVLLLVSGFLSLYFYDETKTVNDFLIGEKHTALYEQVSKQKEINELLEKVASEKKYTFKDAYVEINPYKISPLSGIIIFNTNKSEEVSVYINDVFVTIMESTNKHVIPIYGLRENFDNKIKLVMNDEEMIYSMKTDDSKIEFPLTVNTRSETLNNEELYFTVASYSTFLTGWDSLGNLRFYLTVDNRMDVEWLDNGHFLIGTSQGQFAENFVSFVEMDYLGKIYNYYVPSNGYSFEFQKLSDGSLMLAGGKKPVYLEEQVIYTINKSDGKTLDLINLSEVILGVDSDFDRTYLGQKAIRNSFHYNEETDELLVSFRGLDAVLSFNFHGKSLNWVYTSPNNELFTRDVWKSYLVKNKAGIYPMGQHSVILTRDGNVGIFNNGYNRLHGFENGGNDLVSYYKDNYSSVDIFKIAKNEATLVWRYDANKTMFSHQYGSVRETNLGYLLDFGYNLKDEYRSDEVGSLSKAEATQDNIYSRIIEVDKNKNILFDATCEEGKYRAFKHGIYNEKTENLKLTELNIYENLKEDEVSESTYKDEKIVDASEWIYSCEFTKNTFTTNYEITKFDDIKFLFVNKTGKTYIFDYKSRDNETINRIFNINLPNGEYALYINLNGNIYKTSKVYKF